MTKLLVLGGGAFVGRAVIDAGLARGWAVTACNRGRTGTVDQRARHLVADRLDPITLARWPRSAGTWWSTPGQAGPAPPKRSLACWPRGPHFQSVEEA